MSAQRILVAGIGNIFFGDDAFGVEVARRFSARPLPENVRVKDFGIRSYDLICAARGGCDILILVDATQQGREPGAVCVMEPSLPELARNPLVAHVIPSGHETSTAEIFAQLAALGNDGPRQVLLVGCGPDYLGGEEGFMGLSERVLSSVDEAVRIVESLIAEHSDERMTHA